MTRPWRSDVVASSISWMIAGQRVRRALDRAGERIAAERAEADLLHRRTSRPGASGMRSSSTMISVPSRSTTGRGFGEVERHDRNVLEVDVLPDVELGPVRQRKDADALALVACARCRGARARAAGAWGPSDAAPSGTRRCAPWRATSPRRGARRRTPRRSRTCRAPASAPASSSRRCARAEP